MYRTIDSALYADPQFRRLPSDARWLYIYLSTNPHTHISGLYYLPVVLLSHETGLTKAAVERSFVRLAKDDFARYDATFELVWVVEMLTLQGLKPGKHTRIMYSIAVHLQSLHKSPLIRAFLAHYEAWDIPYIYPIDRDQGNRQGQGQGKKDKEGGAGEGEELSTGAPRPQPRRRKRCGWGGCEDWIGEKSMNFCDRHADG